MHASCISGEIREVGRSKGLTGVPHEFVYNYEWWYYTRKVIAGMPYAAFDHRIGIKLEFPLS